MDCVLLSLLGISQVRVHLDQVNGNEVARLVYALTDKVAFTESETAADGCAGAGSPHGVEGIDIKGQVDGSVVTDVSKGHLDDAANTVTANEKLVNAINIRTEIHTGQHRAC